MTTLEQNISALLVSAITDNENMQQMVTDLDNCRDKLEKTVDEIIEAKKAYVIEQLPKVQWVAVDINVAHPHEVEIFSDCFDAQRLSRFLKHGMDFTGILRRQSLFRIELINNGQKYGELTTPIKHGKHILNLKFTNVQFFKNYVRMEGVSVKVGYLTSILLGQVNTIDSLLRELPGEGNYAEDGLVEDYIVNR